MRNTIRYIDPTGPILNRNNMIPLDHLKVFFLEVYKRGLLIGVGPPDGILEAFQGQEYMDEEGSPGSVKWIKQVDDIGGDRTLGWIAIG